MSAARAPVETTIIIRVLLESNRIQQPRGFINHLCHTVRATRSCRGSSGTFLPAHRSPFIFPRIRSPSTHCLPIELRSSFLCPKKERKSTSRTTAQYLDCSSSAYDLQTNGKPPIGENKRSARTRSRRDARASTRRTKDSSGTMSSNGHGSIQCLFLPLVATSPLLLDTPHSFPDRPPFSPKPSRRFTLPLSFRSTGRAPARERGGSFPPADEDEWNGRGGKRKNAAEKGNRRTKSAEPLPPENNDSTFYRGLVARRFFYAEKRVFCINDEQESRDILSTAVLLLSDC